jgi:hypothetical protein
VRVHTYFGDTPDESARQFEEDSANAAAHGYFPSSQAWNGPSLTVTYLYRDQRHQQEGATWNPAAVGVVIAGVLGGVAAILPWVSATNGFVSISRTGLDGGGDGIITILLSIGIGILGLGLIQGHPPIAAIVSAFLLSIALLGVAVWDGVNVSGRISNQTSSGSSVLVSIGVGLWLTGVAGIVGIVAAMATYDPSEPY